MGGKKSGETRKILSEAKKKVAAVSNAALREASEEIAKDFYDLFRTHVDEFYEDYIPKYYSRTYSLYTAATKVVKRHNDYLYTAGIILADSPFESEYDVRIGGLDGLYWQGTEVVYDVTLVQGYHGTKRVKKAAESVIQKLDKDRKDYLDYGLKPTVKKAFRHHPLV